MSEKPKHQTSRLGVIFVLVAVGGSAIGVVGWHLASNRSAGLDTSGFDMSTAPDPADSAAPHSFPAAAPSGQAPEQRTSLSMVKGDKSITVVGPGASTPKASGASGAAGNPADPKQEAALTMKEAALKYEKLVAGFVQRMEKKHPSITQFGRDWAASPELRAIRDQYWKEKDPVKFAYGIVRSNDFSKLVKKYAGDAGIRDALVTGIKESPPGLTSAVGGVLKSDTVAKGLVTTVIKAVGLPASLTGFLDGSDAKAPDPNQVMADIMSSPDMKKAMQNKASPVSLDQSSLDKAKDAVPNNGFTPLGGR